MNVFFTLKFFFIFFESVFFLVKSMYFFINCLSVFWVFCFVLGVRRVRFFIGYVFIKWLSSMELGCIGYIFVFEFIFWEFWGFLVGVGFL